MEIAIVVGRAGRPCLRLLRCGLIGWPPRPADRCSLRQDRPVRGTVFHIPHDRKSQRSMKHCSIFFLRKSAGQVKTYPVVRRDCR
jgi:hypothetical protein